MIRRAVCLLIAAAALAPAAAATPARSCRVGQQDTRWKAVFGHFSHAARAHAYVQLLRTNGGFGQARVQDLGCGDFAVTLLGLDTQRKQAEFAAEAADAGYPGVSYQTSSTESLKLPKGTWRAVLGTFRTVDEASKLQQKAAAYGFRLSDVEYVGPRQWRVTVFAVPQAKSQEFAREVTSVGLRVVFEIS